MKFIVLLSLLCTVWAALETDRQLWLSYKDKHGKTYTDVQEEQLRFNIFRQNLRAIKKHNDLFQSGLETYQMGINKFADLSREEYLAILKRQSGSRTHLRTDTVVGQHLKSEVPDSIDWREAGAVSRVKDQGSCGSCWAFSVTGTLESFYYLKNKEMVTFSEQQLVDCDTSNTGCLGGEEAPALEYIKNYGIQTEDSYPYEEKTSSCRYNESATYTKVVGYVQIDAGDEITLLNAVGSLGPVSVALDASGLPFYQKGVFTSTTCSQLFTNHAVLAVGYGFDEDTGLDYWLIKNSWGEGWGEDGYFKIKRGTNECAIAIDNVYPVL